VEREPTQGKDAEVWDAVQALEGAFPGRLAEDAQDAANTLLELDRIIWQAQQEKENPDFISEARERFREFIVLIGMRLASAPKPAHECLAPLVEELLALRARFRENNQWQEADAIRGCLKRVNIEVDDTQEGYHWRLGAWPR
jgi:cysteinyl-tRNA synthetase